VGEPERYYDLRPVLENGRAEVSYTDACTLVREGLRRAVVSQRVSDVPLGAFLSGGMDSSIVVAHLAEASARPVKTFSIGYADQRMYDESAYARLVAARFGTEHHHVVLGEGDVLAAIPRVLDQIVRYLYPVFRIKVFEHIRVPPFRLNNVHERPRIVEVCVYLFICSRREVLVVQSKEKSLYLFLLEFAFIRCEIEVADLALV